MHFHYEAIPQDLINVADNRERGFDSWFAPEDSKRGSNWVWFDAQ